MPGFTQDHVYTHENGQVFGTGLVARKHAGKLPVYAPAGGTIDRAQWPALLAGGAGNLSAAVQFILDQGSKPWCWAFSATQAAMMLAWLLYRRAIIFDPGLGPIITRVYGGNSIDAMVSEVQAPVGCLPVADTGSDPVLGALILNQHKWSPNWKTDAAKHQITGWNECPSFESLVTGLLRGCPGVIGVNWQGGGHALAVALISYENGVYYVHGPNSWGPDFKSGWGSDPDRPGWYKLSEALVTAAFSGESFGAYVISAEMADATVDPAPGPLQALAV